PEELSYLFLTIAIGLGCGAGLTILTIVAFIGFTMVIWFNKRFQQETESQNLYLTISSNQPGAVDLKVIIDELKKHCSAVRLKRSDETPSAMEVSFFVEFDDFEKMEQAKTAIKNIHSSVAIAFMDNTRDF
ncbi:MAG: hypothetical protein ACXVNN_10880, partial [Bacteroidia bacterium]